MREEKDSTTFTPMRARFPAFHDLLIERLNACGVQPYDVLSEVTTPLADHRVMIRIRHGTGYQKRLEFSAVEEDLICVSSEVSAFLERAVDQCRTQTVDDYKAFMQSQP